jgi:hypothetical protein
LPSYCCSLFVTVSVCRQPDASFSQLKSLSKIQHPLCPLNRLRFRILSFIKRALISNFLKILQDGLLFFEFKSWNTSSALRTTKFHSLYIFLSLGANDPQFRIIRVGNIMGILYLIYSWKIANIPEIFFKSYIKCESKLNSNLFSISIY